MKAYIITHKEEPTVENSPGNNYYKSKKTAEKVLKFVLKNMDYKTKLTIIEVNIEPVYNWLKD